MSASRTRARIGLSSGKDRPSRSTGGPVSGGRRFVSDGGTMMSTPSTIIAGMTDDMTEAVEALLGRTQAAHGAYEATELNGVYDEAWPRWYAEYAVEHGLGDVLGRPIDADELAAFFTSAWDEAKRADPEPTEPWRTSTARAIVAKLRG